MKTKGKLVAISSGILAAVVLGVAAWFHWPHIYFYYLFEPLGQNPQSYQEYRHRQTGIIFVKLPGGTFRMGAQGKDPNGQNHDPDAQNDEGPVHEVTLSGFMIAKCEVSQGQWQAVMGENPSTFKGDDHLPLENVSWDDIQGFEAKTGLTLPMEAQWEYACRAGTTTPYAGKLEDLGWFDGNSGGNTTHPVGKKAPNGFGLFDMHGNVWEWCEDVYDERFYSKPDALGHDPVSTAGSVDRVNRGGCWRSFARDCRSAGRDGDVPSNRYGFLGIRPSSPAP